MSADDLRNDEVSIHTLFSKEQFIEILLQSLKDERIIQEIRQTVDVRDYLEEGGKVVTYIGENQIKELNRRLKESEKAMQQAKRDIAQREEQILQLQDQLKQMEQQSIILSLEKGEELKQAKQQNVRLTTENKDWERQCRELEDQKYNLEDRLELEKEKVVNLQNRFGGIEDVHHVFLQLSKECSGALRGIFKGDTMEEFLVCGVQYDNIDSLWEFIKREAIEGRIIELESLIYIFNYFFHAHNKIYDTPLYEMQPTKIGQNFDEDLHIRTGSSKVIGQIKEVVLQGYKNVKTNKITKKSIVTI